MEIASGLRGEKRNTTVLLGNEEATIGGPILEHKMTKNVLEDVLVRQRCKTEATCNKNWNQCLCLA